MLPDEYSTIVMTDAPGVEAQPPQPAWVRIGIWPLIFITGGISVAIVVAAVKAAMDFWGWTR